MKHLAPYSILFAFLCSICYSSAASSNILVQDPSRDNSEECTCYLTSGPSESFFQHHRFWDFRSIPSEGTNHFTLAPPILTNADDLTSAPPTSTYLATSDFATDWSIQNWTAEATPSSPATRVNSAQNIYISRNTTADSADGHEPTYLTLRASRLEDFISTAELESNQKNLFHSSIRARMRVIPNDLLPRPSSPDTANPNHNTTHPITPGAVAALFTYSTSPPPSESESDIEILTRDPPTSIRYSNQPDFDPHTDSPIAGASTQSTLPANKTYTSWLDHRLDWFAGVSRWYVDGELVLEKMLNVPQAPSGLVLNLWGDAGEWSGDAPVGSAAVVLGVQWIELVFNTSGGVDGPAAEGNPDGVGETTEEAEAQGDGKSGFTGLMAHAKRDAGRKCTVACTVDGIASVGFPEVAFNATARSGAAGLGAGAEAVLALLAVWAVWAVLWGAAL